MATLAVRIYRMPPDEYAPDSTLLARGMLTDEHAASSYGQPVIVIAGRAYGPGDLAKDCWLADDTPWNFTGQEFIEFPAPPAILTAWDRVRLDGDGVR